MGNVRAVVSDVKVPTVGGDGALTSLTADVVSATDYYPFGMQMPGRVYNGPDYRYGFNGMEKDDEVKGNGNHLDYGARGYDPRLGRWLSIDPLFAKYPYQSPYGFVGNNPILNKEIDGRDYAIYVDHKTKTIIIKAVYYTEKGDKNSHNAAVQATKFWNDQSGKFQYVIGRKEETIRYDIKFDLSVKEIETDPLTQIRKDRSTSVSLGDLGKITTDGSSNAFKISPDEADVFKDEEDPEKVRNGVTTFGVMVDVKESRKGTPTGSHEMGHTLGFNHLTSTIMSEASNEGRSKRINTIVVGRILKNGGLGKRNSPNYLKGSGAASVQPSSGNAPSNFESGRVKNKKNE